MIPARYVIPARYKKISHLEILDPWISKLTRLIQVHGREEVLTRRCSPYLQEDPKT